MKKIIFYQTFHIDAINSSMVFSFRQNFLFLVSKLYQGKVEGLHCYIRVVPKHVYTPGAAITERRPRVIEKIPEGRRVVPILLLMNTDCRLPGRRGEARVALRWFVTPFFFPPYFFFLDPTTPNTWLNCPMTLAFIGLYDSWPPDDITFFQYLPMFTAFSGFHIRFRPFSYPIPN